MRPILLILSIFVILSNVFAQQSAADQVKSVQDDPRVKAAFDYIDKDRDAILRSLLGQWWYLLCSTYGLAAIGVGAMVVEVRHSARVFSGTRESFCRNHA